MLIRSERAGDLDAIRLRRSGRARTLDIAVVVFLGHTGYYPRFGFEPAAGLGIVAPDPTWGEHFQARTLTAWTTESGGEFHYAAPFDAL
jgi:putative acetyltransferase